MTYLHLGAGRYWPYGPGMSATASITKGGCIFINNGHTVVTFTSSGNTVSSRIDVIFIGHNISDGNNVDSNIHAISIDDSIVNSDNSSHDTGNKVNVTCNMLQVTCNPITGTSNLYLITGVNTLLQV